MCIGLATSGPKWYILVLNEVFKSFRETKMKKFYILFVLLAICLSMVAQNQGNDAAAIRQQMSAIRKSTNWSDPAAAKAANVKIQDLATKLTQAIRNNNPQQQPVEIKGLNSEESAEIQQQNDDYNNKLWTQMMKIVREGGKWDLAEPLRKEIVEEYEEDESPKVLSPEFLQEMTFLCLDMSMPGVNEVIDQMENYKSIQTLVITGGKNGAAVDLENIIRKASKYPLQQLYIINFRNFVTRVPLAIGNFQNLNYLALYNNNIKELPANLALPIALKSLYMDINPISSLAPSIGQLSKLDSLGIAKTAISDDEIKRIKLQLPNCKILLQ